MDESGSPVRAGCFLCGRATYDPGKRERPWSRGVAEGRQVLVCPVCQVERSDWMGRLDRCARCDSTRLSLMLGSVVCRQCGHIELPAEEGAESGSGSAGITGA
jgi:rubredoxin